jgi:molybdopterin-guanine dinucleotide biosynthesis protein A
VPHSCRTLAPYSLHLSFDLADRGVHIGTLLEMLYKFYERDCAPAYASEERKLEHLAALGASPALREAARGALASYRAELRAYRSRMGASRVHFFDGLLKGGDGGR